MLQRVLLGTVFLSLVCGIALAEDSSFPIEDNFQIFDDAAIVEMESPSKKPSFKVAAVSFKSKTVRTVTDPSPDSFPENNSDSLFFYEDGNEAIHILDTSFLLKGVKEPQVWPLSGIITSPYGVRRGRKVIRRKEKKRVRVSYTRHHAGIDIAAPVGSPIVAPSEAVVAFVGVKGGYGKTVVLSHGGGITSLYAHNSEIYVEEGEKIGAQTLISRVGTTGRSTGPHLHFEIRQDGTPINPMKYLGKVPMRDGSKKVAQSEF